MTNMCSLKSYKVWSCDRELKKSVTANDLNELKLKGATKLGYNVSQSSQLRLVLETDGTEIEDESYFQTAAPNTIFILLKDKEKWVPPGLEEIKAAIETFPGNVTIVLQLDKKNVLETGLETNNGWKLKLVSKSKDQKTKAITKVDSNHLSSQNLSANDAAKLILEGLKDEPSFAIYKSSPRHKKFYKNDLDDEEYEFLKKSQEMLSPNHDYNHDHSKCDFHCSSFHQKGAQIDVNKGSFRSSFKESLKEFETVSDIQETNWSKSALKGRVRFSDSENLNLSQFPSKKIEIENLTQNEHFSDCYLLLVDQLSSEKPRHLSVKDIGIILEQLSSKIVDVDCLMREKESHNCFKWLIKAKIKGEFLKSIGVVYSGQYYEIIEHPKWKTEKTNNSTFL